MKSLGFQTYLPGGGQSAASHIHRLVRIDEAPYRYRRVHCGARLQRLYARWPRAKHVDKIMGMLAEAGICKGAKK